ISSYWTRTDNNVWQMQVAGLASDVSTNLDEFKQTSANADNALSQRINTLDTQYKKADTDMTARIAREETARANGDNANAQALRTLESTVQGVSGRVGTSESKIATLERTTSDTNQALATAQSQLNARFDSGNLFKSSTATNGHFLDENNGGQLTAWASHRASDFISVKTNTVYEIRSFEGNFSNLRVIWLDENKEFIKGQIIAKGGDYATFNSENASFVRISSYWTRTDNNVWQMQVAGLASDVSTNLDEFKSAQATKDTATARAVQTLQTTVQGQTASIQQHAQSLNGLNAQYTVKVQTGGIVAGIGLASNNGVSDFAVRADKFYVAPPAGGKGSMPFMVLASPQVINGVTVPAGTYIDSAYIANGSIDVAKINRASIQSLSALSANIGHFKSAETGARLEIKDGVLLVYDNNNRLRVRLGVW
ncbi:phage tail tip fiber protein, partial [Moraxella lacunata]